MTFKISAIVAVDEEGGIGKDGKMAWHIPEDFKHFKEYTKGSLCIMGSVTYQDIRSHKKTTDGEFLPGRVCFVLSKEAHLLREECPYSEVYFASDGNMLKDIIYFSSKSPAPLMLPVAKIDEVCIVGGKSVYELFFDITDTLIVTRVKGTHGCDTKMDLTPYENIATTVHGCNLGVTPHMVEYYILSHE